MPLESKFTKRHLSIILISTFLYWIWESQAQGNIRIDLFLFYPILFATYIGAFWKGYRFYSILFSCLIMMLNIIFFIFSYQLFDKNPG